MMHRKDTQRKSLKRRLLEIDGAVAALRRIATAEAAGLKHVPRGAPSLRRGKFGGPVVATTVLSQCAPNCPVCEIERRYGQQLQRLNAEEREIRGLLAQRERKRPEIPEDKRHVGEPKADVGAVLRAIALGEKHEVIARDYGISLKTVGNYKRKYRGKG